MALSQGRSAHSVTAGAPLDDPVAAMNNSIDAMIERYMGSMSAQCYRLASIMSDLQTGVFRLTGGDPRPCRTNGLLFRLTGVAITTIAY